MKIEIIIRGESLEEGITIGTEDLKNYIVLGKKIKGGFLAQVISGELSEDSNYILISGKPITEYKESLM